MTARRAALALQRWLRRESRMWRRACGTHPRRRASRLPTIPLRQIGQSDHFRTRAPFLPACTIPANT
jgi:hypothetical protein